MHGKPIFRDDFSDLEPWTVRKHVNGMVVNEVGPDGRRSTLSPLEPGAKAVGCCLKYAFRSAGHDAVMVMRRGLAIHGASRLTFDVQGNGSGCQLFVVLTEASGEQHLIQNRPLVDWCGLKSLSFDIDALRLPQQRCAADPFHWDGDGNQKLDDPIVAILIGLGTPTDAFQGQGEIQLGRLEFWAEGEGR